VISVGLFGKPSFQNALTTGTILAEDGEKMSKSKKNYPDPMLVVNKYGVDSLRLYLMSSVVMKADNLNFSEREVGELRKKVFVIWWNICSFFKQYADPAVDVRIRPTGQLHVMDRWLLARLDRCITQVTASMDGYDVVRASRFLIEFVDEFSTWYLRLSRERLKDESDDAARQRASQTLGFTLHTLAQLFAPLTPFFSEVIHHNLVDETSSVHLTDWPIAGVVDETLLGEMTLVRKVVEAAHAVRKEAGVKVRQPLAALNVTDQAATPSDELQEVLQQEVNVKKVVWKKAAETAVCLDTSLTPELVAEGKAREIMRSIQQLRKEAGVAVSAFVDIEVPDWPVEWEEQIKAKTKVRSLTKGAELKIH
jgi:isoleucyl-tRNA synthetase